MMRILITIIHHTRQFAALLLCSVLVAAFMLPMSNYAKSAPKTVRVGWYESPFNLTDEYGRRSGYAYEYQQKISAYTGWNYEYVEGSWPELLQMLIDGEIDLMSDVSYTDERSELMLFSELSMGAEEYYVFVSPDNESCISTEDFSSFSGKRIGVNKGSLQESLFLDWAKKKNIKVEIVELTMDEDESVAMLKRGELDALVSIYALGWYQTVVPMCKIGSADFFFAVNKSRPELLSELDYAMNRIHEENVYYTQSLYSKYIGYSGEKLFLTARELKWLDRHGPIRVGYRDDYLAFCAQDPDTGELTGALKDFLDYASHSEENAEIEFEAVPFRSPTDALDALIGGEVDCLFPTNISDYDGEEIGLSLTVPLMQTEIVAVVRQAAQREFSLQEEIRVAVNEGNPDYDTVLMNSFPNWKCLYFEDTEECLSAVAEGKADCVLVSNFRVSSFSEALEKYRLTTVATGETMTFSFAVKHEDSTLYAIMDKVINLVPPSFVNASLATYSYTEQTVTFASFIRHNIIQVLTFIVIVFAFILLLLFRSIHSERNVRKAMQRIAALSEDQNNKLMEISKLNTDLSESQQNLKEALEAAEQASLAKTSFLSNMSHEIRTPMNAIIGLNNVALKDKDLSHQTKEQLEKIGSSAKHLLDIINDILDMSRIESGNITLKDEEFCFGDFLDQINIIINSQCVEKGLEYDCRIINNLDEYYTGDYMKLKQVLINILGNAVKYTEEPGTVTFTVEQTSSYEDHRSLRFVISDTGIGMSREYIPRIFEAFSQEKEEKSNKYGSTGLGMAITKRIVTMMNGNISVESEKGVGSTFTVTVTLKASDRSVNKDNTIKALPDGLRAIVVDDDPVSCEHARAVAEAAGVRAVVASECVEALEMIRSKASQGEPYQIILVDWMMPGMDGIEFTRELRKNDNGESMVILLTGFSWDGNQDEAYAEGIDMILNKPLFTERLICCIQDIMSRRGQAGKSPDDGSAADTGAPSKKLKGASVMVVEDMDINAEIIIALLGMEGIRTERAENGQIAVEQFSEHPKGYYDAILMDVRMPVMDGLEATRAIRKLDRADAMQIPIIAMTANAFDEDVQQSLQAGMNAHLTKPVNPEQLYQTLEELIREADQ